MIVGKVECRVLNVIDADLSLWALEKLDSKKYFSYHFEASVSLLYPIFQHRISSWSTP